MTAFRNCSHFLLSLLLSFFVIYISQVTAEGSIDLGLDSTLNHVQYGSVLNTVDSLQHRAERLRVAEFIAKPEDEVFGTDHPRYDLLYAMYGFYRHQDRYIAETNRGRSAYAEIPEHQRKVNPRYMMTP
jgi:hypothetical protein